MAKYSTGSGGVDSGDSCELCGASETDLRTANVAGATLQVCSDCVQHDDQTRTEQSSDERNRKRRAAQNTARVHDATKGDASHWEDGADYDDDQLPYLVDGYGDRFTEARQDAGLQLDELAAELGVEEKNLLALEQERAAQAGLGGSIVAAVEEFLEVELAETQ